MAFVLPITGPHRSFVTYTAVPARHDEYLPAEISISFEVHVGAGGKFSDQDETGVTVFMALGV